MNLLKQHRAAIIITCLVIVLSVFFGAHRSLTAERAAAERMFFNSPSGSSIAQNLEARLAVGANLSTVASKYFGEDDAKILALRAACDALKADLQNPALGQDLTTAMDAIFTPIMHVSTVTEADAQYLRGFEEELTSRSFAIANNIYNDRAEQFNRVTLATFPANLFARVLRVPELPTYRL